MIENHDGIITRSWVGKRSNSPIRLCGSGVNKISKPVSKENRFTSKRIERDLKFNTKNFYKCEMLIEEAKQKECLTCKMGKLFLQSIRKGCRDQLSVATHFVDDLVRLGVSCDSNLFYEYVLIQRNNGFITPCDSLLEQIQNLNIHRPSFKLLASLITTYCTFAVRNNHDDHSPSKKKRRNSNSSDRSDRSFSDEDESDDFLDDESSDDEHSFFPSSQQQQQQSSSSCCEEKKNDFSAAAMKVFNVMSVKFKYKPNTYLLNSLLNMYCKLDKRSQFWDLVVMNSSELNIPYDSFTYGSLMEMCLKEKNYDKLEDIYFCFKENNEFSSSSSSSSSQQQQQQQQVLLLSTSYKNDKNVNYVNGLYKKMKEKRRKMKRKDKIDEWVMIHHQEDNLNNKMMHHHHHHHHQQQQQQQHHHHQHSEKNDFYDICGCCCYSSSFEEGTFHHYNNNGLNIWQNYNWDSPIQFVRV